MLTPVSSVAGTQTGTPSPLDVARVYADSGGIGEVKSATSSGAEGGKDKGKPKGNRIFSCTPAFAVDDFTIGSEREADVDVADAKAANVVDPMSSSVNGSIPEDNVDGSLSTSS